MSAKDRRSKYLQKGYLARDEDVLVETHASKWFFFPGPVVALVVLLGLDYAAAAGVVGFLPAFPYLTRFFSGLPIHVFSGPTGAALLVLAVLGLLTVAALAWLATRWGEWLSDVYVVTSDRLIEQTGLVRHEIREIPLDQVRNIDVDQVSLVARAFGYGSLRINSLQTGRSGGQAVPLVHTMNPRNIAADAAGVEFWVGVPDPLKIQRRIEWAHEGLNPQPRRRAAQAA